MTTSPLRAGLDAVIAEHGCSLKDPTVLAPKNDPFRLDTPARHRDGLWLAQTAADLGLGDRRIHLRGLHYGDAILTPRSPATSAQLKVLHHELTALAPDSSATSPGLPGALRCFPAASAGWPSRRSGTGRLIDDRASSVASAPGELDPGDAVNSGTRGSL
jgi:hypothetical protein